MNKAEEKQMTSDKALEKWFAEHVIVLGSGDTDADVNKIRSALETEFGIDQTTTKKEEK